MEFASSSGARIVCSPWTTATKCGSLISSHFSLPVALTVFRINCFSEPIDSAMPHACLTFGRFSALLTRSCVSVTTSFSSNPLKVLTEKHLGSLLRNSSNHLRKSVPHGWDRGHLLWLKCYMSLHLLAPSPCICWVLSRSTPCHL